MTAPGIRERIAIALTAASVVVACVFGVMAVRSYTQPASGVVADVGQGNVSGAQGGNGVSTGSPGTGDATGGGSSGGGSGGVSGGNITIGGFFDISGPVDSSVERDTVRAYMQAVNASGGS